MCTRRSKLSRRGVADTQQPGITFDWTRCSANKQTPQLQPWPRTSEGVALAPRHRSAMSSDTAKSALSRLTWKIRGCGSVIRLEGNTNRGSLWVIVICIPHKVFSARMVLASGPTLSLKWYHTVTLDTVGPGPYASAWFVRSGVCRIGHKSRRGEGDLCAVINFYTSNKHQIPDYTFNHLSPPLTRLEHWKCPPSCLFIHSSEHGKDEYHTPPSLFKISAAKLKIM